MPTCERTNNCWSGSVVADNVDSRSKVQEDGPTKLYKTCYDLVLRVKKNDEDVKAKKESLTKRLAKSRSFFGGSKHPREPLSPWQLSKIPTPTRSPALKRMLTEEGQRRSARALSFGGEENKTPRASGTLASKIPTPTRSPSKRFLAVEPHRHSAKTLHAGTIAVREQHAQVQGLKGLIHPRHSSSEASKGGMFTDLPALHLECDKQKLQLLIVEECERLCSANSVFKKKEWREGFSWQSYEEEMKRNAPTLWLILNTASTSLGTTYIRKKPSYLPVAVVAAAVLRNECNSHVCGVQLLLSLLQW